MNYGGFVAKLHVIIRDSESRDRRTCISCGDSFLAAASELTGKHCPECYAEITYDIIGPPPQPGPQYGRRKESHIEETNPGFENIERLYEDMG
jgi:predicted RNA-binding Zn-ribbon protein involved in translation (DUF1610 family)